MVESKSTTKCKETVVDSERSARILERLQSFKKINRFCNIDIQNSSFSANALLLAVCYDYFEESILGKPEDIMKKMKECYEKVSPAAIEVLDNYFNTNKLDIDEDKIDEILTTSFVLNLTDIFDECLIFLEKNIRSDNCIRNMKLGKKYLDENLHKKALLYIVEHFSEIRHQEDFLKLEQEEIYELLKHSDLNVYSEKVVFESLKMWILYNKTNRIQHIKKLFNLIKLPLLPTQYLFDAVSPLVYLDPECNQLLNEALRWQILSKRKSDLRPYWTIPRKSTQVILAAGDWELNQSKMLDIYDPVTNIWTHYMDLNLNKQRFGSALIDNKLLTFGGDVGKEPLNTVHLTDLKTKSTILLSSLNHARSCPVAVELDNYIYAIGGIDLSTGKALSVVEKWDPNTQKWNNIAPLQTPRFGTSAVAINGNIFVMGGSSDGKTFSSVEIYDPATNTWEVGIPMVEKRKWISAVAVNEFIYVFGGDDTGGPRLKTAEKFDTKLKKWTNIENLIYAGDGIGNCVLSDKVICVGGYESAIFNHVQEYDTKKNTWKYLAPTLANRAHVRLLTIARDLLAI
ncbi:kelch-like protein 4 [Arctopsyche grandis]|uniref:kelch-like protein 4 n=1 Tax=Arctopsyche grandis TaxID=121162 RepID=UPI00406D7717